MAKSIISRLLSHHNPLFPPHISPRLATTLPTPSPSLFIPSSSLRLFPISHRISHHQPPSRHAFSTTVPRPATLNQVLRGCRSAGRTRRSESPALVLRPQMKGVCLKVGITKPKKPNSAERKTARVRLSSGRTVTCYIPGEGQWV